MVGRVPGDVTAFTLRSSFGGVATVARDASDALRLFDVRRREAGPEGRVRAGVLDENTATSHKYAVPYGDDVAVRGRGDLIVARAPREPSASRGARARRGRMWGCRSKRLWPVVQNGTPC